MTSYARVSYGVRCQIFALLQAKTPIREIALITGFNKSTIYREIKRNKGLRNLYEPESAQKLAQRRYQNCRRQYAITNNFKPLIRAWLSKGLSPEHISGRLRLEFKKGPSHSTIYKYVRYAGLRNHLRRHGKRGAGRHVQRRRARELKYGLSINKRPEIANRRGRIGDWERDTMHTKNGVQLLICQDRKSRLIKLAVVKKRTTLEVGKLTEKLIHSTKKRAFTVTNDNGGDFKGRSEMTLRTYFCDPLCPHQRGSVERVIKSIRQYIGRKTDVLSLGKKRLQEIEDLINFRPRKVLDYKTPYEVYYNKRVALADLI